MRRAARFSRRDALVVETVLWVAVLWSLGELFGVWRLALRLFGPVVRAKLDRLTSAERVRVEKAFTRPARSEVAAPVVIHKHQAVGPSVHVHVRDGGEHLQRMAAEHARHHQQQRWEA